MPVRGGQTVNLLIIDANNIAARAFYALPSLMFEGNQTGAIYGFLRYLVEWYARWKPDAVAFCFDEGTPKRREILACYKADRYGIDTDMHLKSKKMLHSQLLTLRREVLPRLGYLNVFSESGYEADDLIASLCSHRGDWDHVMIASSDHDLYQLLDDGVMVYDPGKKELYDRTAFEREYGVEPSLWPTVKALAGCKSDNVKGVMGVGEKTAAKYLTGKLAAKSAAYRSIIAAKDHVERNLRLTSLPYPGTPKLKVSRDRFNAAKWRALLKDFGITGIAV